MYRIVPYMLGNGIMRKNFFFATFKTKYKIHFSVTESRSVLKVKFKIFNFKSQGDNESKSEF